MTITDLRHRTDVSDPKRVEKAKKLTSYYVGVNPNGDILFRTPSQTIPSTFYLQYVRLLDLPTLRKSPFYVREPSRLFKDALKGSIAVYCTDPSFLYWGWQYISYTLDYGWNPARYPSIRNPSLNGAICKHLYHVLMVLPFNMMNIQRDMRKMGLLSLVEESEELPRLKEKKKQQQKEVPNVRAKFVTNQRGLRDQADREQGIDKTPRST